MKTLARSFDVGTTIESFLNSLTDSQALCFIFIENVIIFTSSVLMAEVVGRVFRQRRVANLRAYSAFEIRLAAFCVFNNIVVTWIGFMMWKKNILFISNDPSWVVSVRDFFLLFFTMDFAMYVFHRLAHSRPLYTLLHKTHHHFIEVRPVTLFALNPAESYGFGFLWLAVVFIFEPTWAALIFYLVVNVIFGSIGHLAVEPFPKWWLNRPVLKHLTTRTFHALHHEHPGQNFGFYTSLWDRIGDSIHKGYREIFAEETRDKH